MDKFPCSVVFPKKEKEEKKREDKKKKVEFVLKVALQLTVCFSESSKT